MMSLKGLNVTGLMTKKGVAERLDTQEGSEGEDEFDFKAINQVHENAKN